MSELSPLMARYQSVLTHSLGIECHRAERDLLIEWRGIETVIADPGDFDPSYCEIYAPVSIDVDGGVLLVALDATNRACKGASVFTGTPGTVIFATRNVVAPPHALPERDHLVAVIPRALSMLLTAMGRFAEELTLLGIAEVSAEVKAAG